MNYRIVRLNNLSGKKATVYSIILEDEQETLFDKFVKENLTEHRNEVIDIVKRLEAIGNEVGAKKFFFKENEGKPGDQVCALYDDPDSNLRLYCIKFSAFTILLGNGGHKPKNIKAWQEDKKLSREAKRMIKISADILQRIRDKEILWSPNGKELTGNLNFNEDEDQ